MRDNVEIGDTVTGTYDPLRIDDLKDDVLGWIGSRIKWYASWVVEGGHYRGQIAMTPHELNGDLPPIGWIPLCDLKQIEPT